MPVQGEERGERAAALLLPEHGQPEGVPLGAGRRHPVGGGDVAVVPLLALGPPGGGGRDGLGAEGVLLALLEAGDLRDVAPVLGDDALAEHRVEAAVEALPALAVLILVVVGLGEGLGPLAGQGHHVGEGGEAARLGRAGGAGGKVVRVVRVYKRRRQSRGVDLEVEAAVEDANRSGGRSRSTDTVVVVVRWLPSTRRMDREERHSGGAREREKERE